MQDISEKPLVFENFAGRLGEAFTVTEQDLPAMPLTLVEAEVLPARYGLPQARPPFSLMFLGKDPGVLPPSASPATP